MTLLDINRISKSYGPIEVLDNISFKVQRGQNVGLIGANGCGKSTLLKIIVGEIEASSGVVSTPSGTRIGYVSQHLQADPDSTVLTEVRRAFGPLLELESRLERAEISLNDPSTASDPNALEKAVQAFGDLQEQFQQAGGYEMDARVDAVIDGLGLTERRDQTLGTLSGGEKNIVALARTLLETPDLLLLDEPANHLDFEGLAWLEGFLQTYDRTVLLVSHNRYLLDRTVTRIVEIESRRIAEYEGNYSSYRAQKMALSGFLNGETIE